MKELIRYRSEGVMTVEMEGSAVFAVGQVRGVETSAALWIIALVVFDNLPAAKPAWKT
jgi:uridine phosphorylase